MNWCYHRWRVELSAYRVPPLKSGSGDLLLPGEGASVIFRSGCGSGCRGVHLLFLTCGKVRGLGKRAQAQHGYRSDKWSECEHGKCPAPSRGFSDDRQQPDCDGR